MKVTLAILSAVVLAVALCSIPVAAQPPVAPTGEAINNFHGTVTIGGCSAPDGFTVSAKIDGVEYDTAVTVDERYGDGPEPEHMLKVPGDDPITSLKDGGRDGDTVEFFVEGVKANETAVFKSMTYSMLDLTVPAFSPAAQPGGEDDQGAEAAAQPEGEDDQEAAQVQGQEDGKAEAAQPGGEEDGEAEAAGGEGGWAWWMTIIMIPAIIVVAAIPTIILDRRRRARAR